MITSVLLAIMFVCGVDAATQRALLSRQAHKYENIVFVYFREQEHLENEPEHLIERVKTRLDENEIRYSSVLAKNIHYKKHGLAHIEIDMNPAKKVTRVQEDKPAEEEGNPDIDLQVEFSESEFTEMMEEEESPDHKHNVHPRDKTKIMKVMKETEGVLSVESMAGISFAKNLP